MPTTRCYYEVLSVTRDASGDEVKRAYRRLAMKYHPDRNPGDTAAEASFKEAAEAYEIIGDPERRRMYDQYGHEGLRQRPGHAMNPDDIFSMFSDIFEGMGGGRGGRRRHVRGYDLEYQLDITLEEAFAGVERDITFTRLDVCSDCDGDGSAPGSSPETCTTCGGNGQVAQAGLGGMFRMVTACPACRGKGKVVSDPCRGCDGRGRRSVERKLSAKIPAGIHSGQAVRLSGEGEPPPPEVDPAGNGQRGDLHVLVRVEQHEQFERDGDDLMVLVPVNFTQLAMGADIEVPTLDSPEPHCLHVPPGTQNGELSRIPNRGMPNLRSGRPGDLVAVLHLVVPRNLSETQRDLLKQYAETEDVAVDAEPPGFWTRIKEAVRGH
ncbi:MAG: molecular chaperone DnaJ [Phycisphaerales bacterium]|nr:molecular chaperone DnaJ [Phycisphaerales bacterium]MDP6310573.1 molecular chaperone DnaJ [Phycisphaerales bacterium]MDP7086856.1 molecular chaperone DnaJ [Phycisphaerales bacterium]MDP7188783.1 molecular chaperone DnaJ [Phycisphaerales bacterium]MDP7519647.1 molecular chaperone DnaJ [Phycisphaerales bacterium]